MNYKVFKFTLPLLVLSLSSCAYGLKEYYRGDAYNSTVFAENYYNVWNSKIDLNNPKNQITSQSERELVDEDYVFENYNDSILRSVDGDTENLEYTKDLYSKNKPDYYLNVGYGPTKKLSRVDSSFKYGYISKLFDGQMFCWGYYQAARVQINENGFGTLFSKEGSPSDQSYFALNLKASYDYTSVGEYDFNYDGVVDKEESMQDLAIPDGEGGVIKKADLRTNVNLKISFYCKNDEGYDKKTFTYKLSNMMTNATENPSIYKFFGFRFNGCNLYRIAGVSVEFELLDNPLAELKDKDGNLANLDYSLMLYEMFIPNTSWN